MKKIFIPLLLILLFLAGNQAVFGQQRKQIQKQNQTIISLELTLCFAGECPMYKVTIFGDGGVNYEGYENVAVKGTSKNKISKTKVAEIITVIEKMDFFSLPDNIGDSERQTDECPNWETDHQTAIVSISLNRKTKKIHHYLGCGGALTGNSLSFLQHKIETVTQTKKRIIDGDKAK